MSSYDFKDLAQAIYSVIGALAIIAGGIWAYWSFIFQREREPRAEFDLTAEFLGHQDGKWLLEVSARLVNKGKVRHLLRDATMNVRYLKATDPVQESDREGLFRQVAFPHHIGRRRVWWDSYIDPGLEFRNSYLTWVPEDATYVLLLCKFWYEKGAWPAQRVLKVPDLPGRAPGSPTSGTADSRASDTTGAQSSSQLSNLGSSQAGAPDHQGS